MKRAMRRSNLVWHFVGSEKFDGPPPGVRGDLTGASGDLSGVRGNLSGIFGNLTGVSGDLDSCEISPAERARGIRIEELIDEAASE